MLSILRRNAGSWAIKIILSFIALTFIWWGVGTYSEQGRNVAATVGGETITTNDLSEAVAGLEKTYREVYGPAFTPEMAKALNLKKQAMDSLVQRKIVLAEAGEMGLSATDEEVQREIAAVPAFQQDGQFREERYRSVLSYNRVGIAEFEASKRVEITMKKIEGLLAAGALVPETEAKELFRVASRKIRLLVVTADPGNAKADAPAEGEILAKYEQAKERFRTPARVKLAVAAFTPDHFGREVQPSEAEITAFHATNSDRFLTEEQRLVSRIVLPFGTKDRDAVRKKAEEVLARASKGKADFDAQAKAHSRGKGGEAWLSRKDAGEALSGPLFQASVDTVVGPVEVPGAFVLARVNRIRFPEALPLSQVRDRVVEQIRREKGKDLAVVKAYEAQPKAVSAKGVKATAAAFGVPVIETGWVGAEGAPGVPAALVQDALLLPSGEVAPVKTLGDAHYLFQVTAKEDSRVPPCRRYATGSPRRSPARKRGRRPGRRCSRFSRPRTRRRNSKRTRRRPGFRLPSPAGSPLSRNRSPRRSPEPGTFGRTFPPSPRKRRSPGRCTRGGKEIPSPWRFPESSFPPTPSGRRRRPVS